MSTAKLPGPLHYKEQTHILVSLLVRFLGEKRGYDLYLSTWSKVNVRLDEIINIAFGYLYMM